MLGLWPVFVCQCAAHVEAIIDFGEEENIEEGLYPEGLRMKSSKVDIEVCVYRQLLSCKLPVKEKIRVLVDEIEQHLEDGRRGERLRAGIHVAIIGAPNAGKSSLLNILCKVEFISQGCCTCE